MVVTRASYAIASHAALDAYALCTEAVDAVVLACFGDPGLEALRELATVPVIGLLDSSLPAAACGGRSFAIVTAGPAWVPMLEERVHLSPYEGSFRGVFAIDSHGLSISRDPDSGIAALQDAALKAVDAEAVAIVLGGSALAGLGRRLAATAEWVDPLEVAIREAQTTAPLPMHSSPPPLASTGLGQRLQTKLLRGAERP